MPQNVIRNVASEGALHRDFDHRMQPAKLRQDRKQIECSELVGRDRQLAFVQFAQLDQGFLCVIA